MPLKLKAKPYRTVVRPILLHGTKTMALKMIDVKKLEVAEMKMYRWNIIERQEDE
jgi:hypothetical protein